MKRLWKIVSLVMALMLVFSLLPCSALAETATEETTILFTHDLHSHFLPQTALDGSESGGYARLETAIDAEREKAPNALLLDAGDFSIGSLIQVLYTTEAAELRTMGALGYDATTLGNHEFDHKGTGFAKMLNAAAASGDTLPALLEANYSPAEDNPDREFILDAMENYGMRKTMILERGGVKYGIFALMGVDSHDCAPTSGFALSDAATAAKECVAELREQGAEFIICLSHSGTSDNIDDSEDEQLAMAVDGIDVIISGHTHTTLYEPIVVNDTYIVSAGAYCKNLGCIKLTQQADGSLSLSDYRLIPIDETLADDAEIAALTEHWKTLVGETYLSRYDLTYDEVLTTSSFDLDTPAYGVQEPNSLGALVADAFLYATTTLASDTPDAFIVTVTADGVLRAPLAKGEITASEAFDVLSMGVGEDGTSGFPLVAVYLTGKELKAAAEVDASVTPIMPAAQLYISGMTYQFNPHRMFFDRVFEIHLLDSDGGLSGIDDNALYCVVTGMYSAEMLSTVKSKSKGLLSLEPKYADGTPVTDFAECILKDENGNEIKEWYALAAYLSTFGESGVPESYQSAGTKVVSDSFSLHELFTSLDLISIIAIVLILAVIAGIFFLVRAVVRRIRRGKKPKKA